MRPESTSCSCLACCRRPKPLACPVTPRHSGCCCLLREVCSTDRVALSHPRIMHRIHVSYKPASFSSTAGFSWPQWAAPLDPTVLQLVNPCTALLLTDGAARGNPGPGGAGAFLTTAGGGRVAAFAHQKIGDSVTNNAAEYEVWRPPGTGTHAMRTADTFLTQAVILGLQLAVDAGCSRLVVCLDSQLAVKQCECIFRNPPTV